MFRCPMEPIRCDQLLPAETLGLCTLWGFCSSPEHTENQPTMAQSVWKVSRVPMYLGTQTVATTTTVCAVFRASAATITCGQLHPHGSPTKRSRFGSALGSKSCEKRSQSHQGVNERWHTLPDTTYATHSNSMKRLRSVPSSNGGDQL